MTDLPTLKIGCNALLAAGLVHNRMEKVYCGDGDVIKAYCETCQQNLDAVNAHAAAYDRELWSPRLPKENIRAEAALVAVLALAGKKTIEELEVKRHG